MPRNYQKIFILNSLAGWCFRVSQIVYFIFLTPILLSALGEERYGAWVLVGQFFTYLIMLDLGVRSSVARFYSRYMAKDDVLSNRQLYSTAGFILVVVGVVIFLVAWFIRNGLVGFYNVKESMVRDFVGALIVYGICLGGTLPLRMFVGVLQAYHKLYYVDICRFLGTLIKFSGVLYLKFFSDMNLTNLAFVMLIGEFSIYLLIMIIAKHFSKGLTKFSFRHINWEMTKRIYSLGIALFISSFLNMIRTQVPITLVGKFIGLAMVQVISVPLQALRNIGAMLTARPGTMFTVMSSELDAVDKKDKIEFLNIEVTKLLLFLSFALALLLAFFSRLILSLWLSDSISEETLILTATSLSIISVPFFIFACLKGIRNTLMATGYHFRVVLRVGVITAGCFSLFFVFMDEVIQVAYVISTTLLVLSLYFVYQFSRYLEKGFLHVLAKIFFRPLCFALLLSLGYLSIKSFVSSELLRALSFCVMAVVLLALTVESRHRKLALKTLSFGHNRKDDILKN